MCVCVCVFTYVCICVCIYLCMCACMYIDIYTQTLNNSSYNYVVMHFVYKRKRTKAF